MTVVTFRIDVADKEPSYIEVNGEDEEDRRTSALEHEESTRHRDV
jgi:hypothetical protein